MIVFKSFELNYDDIIQLDGTSPNAHIIYRGSPVFHGIDGREDSQYLNENDKDSEEMAETILNQFVSNDTTENNLKESDRVELWKKYWLEYIYAFDKMIEVLPDSIVTAFLGRQAIEIGFKYLLRCKGAPFKKTHDIGDLCKQVFTEYDIHEEYMRYVDKYCMYYYSYIEGAFSEYFRFPEYKNNKSFGGGFLDLRWLSYNAALVLVKLIHYIGMDN